MTMRTALLSALLFLLVAASPVWASDPVAAQESAAAEQPAGGAAPVCTDLSGKVRLPCPAEKDKRTRQEPASSGQNAAKPSAPAAAVAGDPIRVFKPAPVSPEAAPAQAESAGQPIQVFKPAAQASVEAAGGDHGNTGPAAEAEPEPRPVAVARSSRAPRSLEWSLPLNLVQDQKSIWTSPLRLRLQNVQWLVPLLGASAVLIASDTDIERHLPTSTSLIKHSNDFSNYGVAAFAGIVGGGYLWSRMTGNAHMRETAVLSGEAAVDSFALTYAIKAITHRDRPLEGNGHGTFWSNGDSFPSEHAAAAWSIASVIAHEYSGPLPTFLAYGGATAITAARVTARKHFASDAVIGGALGWFVGRQVYRAHHDQSDRAAYGTFERSPRGESSRDPSNMGSPFLPLDSWVYPAMDRLAALGYAPTAFAGLRPWTRMECARLLDAAATRLQAEAEQANPEAMRLLSSLQAEFALESARIASGRNLGAQVESIYTRFTGISGKPLNDSYHFGQTLINDYGRPYQEGFNMVTGFSSHAEAGPLAFYVRGEYQHAPGAPAYPLGVRQAIATMDGNPVQPAVAFAAHDDFQLLDTYVALNIKNNQISFGRQSLWWGPGQGSALMFSDNALPMYMLRWSLVSPVTLPSVLGYLGPMRTEVFIGRLEGHHFPGNPYISAQKISFKPTPNLEVGFSKLSVFAGGGTPLTWHSFEKATFNYNDANPATADLPGFDPGDRRSAFNFSYRLPGLRKWLTLYSDALADDDPSPLAAPRRAAFNPGIYLTHVPGLPRLDFRAEAAYTDPPSTSTQGGKFIYWNTRYHDSHTNAGNLMGSWVGRQGRGLQLSSNYWFSAQNTVGFAYRHGQVSQDFFPGGGTLSDFSAKAEFKLRRDLWLDSWLQYEHWNFPILSNLPQSNVTTSVQFTYRPSWGHK